MRCRRPCPAAASTRHDQQRLSVLDIPTTIDILTLLREAHTGQPPPTPTDSPPPTALDAADAPTEPPAVGDEPDQSRPPGAFATGDDTATGPDNPPQSADRPPAPTTEATTPRVKVEILGRATVRDTTGAPITGMRGTAIEMLVYLALHRDGANIPDIQEAIWPDATLRRAAQRLSTTVANLRTSIRRAAGIKPDQQSDFKPVINTGGRYHLNPNCLDIDWWRILDATLHAAAAGDTDTRRQALQDAVANWHGLPHDDNYECIDAYQHTCRQHGITIHTQLAELVAETDPSTRLSCSRPPATSTPSTNTSLN